jgi:phage terminase Nu1 subunit (DNA packaging protein)
MVNPTPQSELMTRAQLAKAIGVSATQASLLTSQGMPVHSISPKNGKAKLYDYDACKAWLQQNQKEDENFASAKLRKEIALASLAELELMQKRGDLIEIVEVSKLVAKEYSTIRAQLLSLPSKLAGLIYTMQDQREVQDALDKAMREVLSELSADASQTTNIKPALLTKPKKKKDTTSDDE